MWSVQWEKCIHKIFSERIETKWKFDYKNRVISSCAMTSFMLSSNIFNIFRINIEWTEKIYKNNILTEHFCCCCCWCVWEVNVCSFVFWLVIWLIGPVRYGIDKFTFQRKNKLLFSFSTLFSTNQTRIYWYVAEAGSGLNYIHQFWE